MTLLPRSLLARAFLLIALVLVLSTTAWYFIFQAYEREPQVHQVARMVTSVVNLVRTALIAAQPGKRTLLLFELEELEGIRLYPYDPAQSVKPVEGDALVRNIQAEIRTQLGEHTRFAREVDGVRGFWVSFHIEEDVYWVVLPTERIPRDPTLQWLGWGLLALALALAAAYVIVSRVTRPLNALAAAARAIGAGKRSPGVPENGPDELRALARTFNQMASDLARLDQDRALILAGVSHDLRTPLARMQLAAEMLGGDAELKKGVTIDIEEMDRIISQFLDFARTDGGERAVPTDLGALATDIAQDYRDRGRPLTLDAAPTPPVPVRPLAIRRLISNLVDNALRYAGPDVTLAIRQAAGQVLIEVLDRGPGIPTAEVERMKQPFQRLERARSGSSGSGLGLAIVERIVRSHGGRLDLLPRQGGGLIARVTLPLRAVPT